MIAPIAIVLALSCPVPTVENISGEPWNEGDQETLNISKIRCGQIYPEAPCVKWFQKRPDRAYRVLCGKTKDSR